MPKNSRLEILSFLAQKHGQPTDIWPLLHAMIEADRHTAKYLEIMLQAMRTNRLISYDGSLHDNGDQNIPFMATIEPQGIIELTRKKKMAGA